jgi:hypothetical protein
VPIVNEISFEVLPAGDPTPELWRARLGAFSPRPAFLGTGALGASGAKPSVVVRPVPRVRVIPAPQAAPMAPFGQQIGQTNNYNHMTSVLAVGEGASGPPPYREPA